MEETKTHPSYGMLEINRVSSSPAQTLFGSSMRHSQMIQLTIKEADVTRGLNRDWYHGHKAIITVAMSYSQFTQAIMSQNTTGTPVTIVRRGLETIPSDEAYETPRDTFGREFNTTLQKLLGNAQKAAKLADMRLASSKPLSKAERDELKSCMFKIEQDIRDNIDFVRRSFEKQMDSTITEAKGEIESFFNNKIHALGSAELSKQIERDEFLQLPGEAE